MIIEGAAQLLSAIDLDMCCTWAHDQILGAHEGVTSRAIQKHDFRIVLTVWHRRS